MINEVDYTTPDGELSEFIELKNRANKGYSLFQWGVVIVNSAGTIIRTISLPAGFTLAEDGYYVICAQNSVLSGCNLKVSGMFADWLPNSGPIGIAVRKGTYTILSFVSV